MYKCPLNLLSPLASTLANAAVASSGTCHCRPEWHNFLVISEHQHFIKLFHVSVAVANIGSLNSICKYFYHKPVKFEQKPMIQTTQKATKFGAFWQKKSRLPCEPYFVISLAPFWNRFLEVKQLNSAKIWIKRLPFFIIPKIRVVWHM